MAHYDLARLEQMLNARNDGGFYVVDRNGVGQAALQALPETIAHLRAAWNLAVAAARDKAASPELRTAARSLRSRLARCRVDPRLVKPRGT
jgi:hypothetical protein